jgi:hypothetical protein
MIVLSVIGLRFAHSKQTLSSVNAFSESFLSSDSASPKSPENTLFPRVLGASDRRDA